MKVLEIGMAWFPEQPGGMDRFYYNLVNKLPGAGVAVRGLVAGSERVLSDSGGFIRSFSPAKIPLSRRLFAVRKAMGNLLAEKKPDLVASHFALYTFPLLDRIRKFPLVIHFHGPWADEGAMEGGRGLVYKAKSTLEKTVYQRADRCIVHTRAFGRLLSENYGVDVSRIRIVPSAVDASLFDMNISRIEARRHLGWPQDRPIVITVRRLVNRMGLENLIEAMLAVRCEFPDALLYIAGTGPLRNTLSTRIKSLGLQDHVRLLGFVADTDLPYAYHAADLSIVPSVALEGFGLTTLESLASGTPVLVTPVGGLPEAVGGLSSALVLGGTGSHALAEGLRAALRGALHLPDAKQCRRYVQENYNWPLIVRQVRSVYQEVL